MEECSRRWDGAHDVRSARSAARKRAERLRLFSFLFNAVADPKFQSYSFVLMKSGFLVRAELDIDLQLPPA
jgi:hypothetical protein